MCTNNIFIISAVARSNIHNNCLSLPLAYNNEAIQTFQHLYRCHHQDIKVLSVCKSKNKHCALEYWFIKMLDLRMNRDQGTLSCDYDYQVRKIIKQQNS